MKEYARLISRSFVRIAVGDQLQKHNHVLGMKRHIFHIPEYGICCKYTITY